jgi:hypothetical protein
LYFLDTYTPYTLNYSEIFIRNHQKSHEKYKLSPPCNTELTTDPILLHPRCFDLKPADDGLKSRVADAIKKGGGKGQVEVRILG